MVHKLLWYWGTKLTPQHHVHSQLAEPACSIWISELFLFWNGKFVVTYVSSTAWSCTFTVTTGVSWRNAALQIWLRNISDQLKKLSGSIREPHGTRATREACGNHMGTSWLFWIEISEGPPGTHCQKPESSRWESHAGIPDGIRDGSLKSTNW